MKVGYCIFGNRIHGAEKRVIKLALSGNKLKVAHLDYFLIVNARLLKNAEKDKELGMLIQNNLDKIIIIPDIEDAILRNLGLLWHLLKYKFRHKIDLFHVYLNARNIAMLLALINVRVVYEITSPDVAETFIRNYPSRRCLYKLLFKINCVSESVYDKVVKGIPDEKVKRKVNYISKAFVSTEPLEVEQLREKRNVIVYASRFIERKNVLLFAHIGKRILAEYPNWEIKIFGSGPLQEKLEDILTNEMKEGRASVGYTNKLIEEFRKSKIVASFIEPDNYPSQSLFEAMALGNALLVSNVGKSAIFVKNNNGKASDDYEEDLKKMMGSEERLYEMGKNSILYFEQHFNQSQYFEELLRIYEVSI